MPRIALTSCTSMDAAAYLTNQGWRGHGHALHHSGRGITKPVHISQKANVLGVGKKQHDAHADQWWARAFDDTLKGLNTLKNDATEKTERVSVGSGVQRLQILGIGEPKSIGQGGLYSNFVRGQGLSGTSIPEKKDHPETRPKLEDHMKQNGLGNNADFSAAVSKDVNISMKKRRQQVGATAERSRMVGFDPVHQGPKNVGIRGEHEKPWERPKDTEADERGRQKRKTKRAKRVREAGGSLDLPFVCQMTTANDRLTSDRPKKRSKEQLHMIKDADPVAARRCNISPDGYKKTKSEKRRRATSFQRAPRIKEELHN